MLYINEIYVRYTFFEKDVNITNTADFLNFLNFIYVFLAALGLRCCMWAFSSCSKRGLLFVAVWASHCGGFSCCGAWAIGAQASVVAAHGLSSCGVRAQ